MYIAWSIKYYQIRLYISDPGNVVNIEPGIKILTILIYRLARESYALIKYLSSKQCGFWQKDLFNFPNVSVCKK